MFYMTTAAPQTIITHSAVPHLAHYFGFMTLDFTVLRQVMLLSLIKNKQINKSINQLLYITPTWQSWLAG